MSDQPKSNSVLVLEDDPGIVEIATFAFQFVGMQVFPSPNISGANSILKTKKIDAIISDVHLNGESGITFYKSLPKTKLDEIHFVFMTGDLVDWNELGETKGSPPKVFYKPCSFITVAEYVSKSLRDKKCG